MSARDPLAGVTVWVTCAACSPSGQVAAVVRATDARRACDEWSNEFAATEDEREAASRLAEARMTAGLRRMTSGPSTVEWSWYTYEMCEHMKAVRRLRARARELRG